MRVISLGLVEVHICGILLFKWKFKPHLSSYLISNLTEALLLSSPRFGVVGFLWALGCRFRVRWEHFRKVKMEWLVQLAASTLWLSNASWEYVRHPSPLLIGWPNHRNSVMEMRLATFCLKAWHHLLALSIQYEISRGTYCALSEKQAEMEREIAILKSKWGKKAVLK